MIDLRLFGPTGSTLDPEAWAPSGCSGADLVAQRVIYALATPRQSVPGNRTFGSSFAELAAEFRTELDLYVAFAGAEAGIVSSVQACETDDDPTNERLGSVALDLVTVDGDGITLSLSVFAADGSRPTVPVDYTYAP